MATTVMRPGARPVATMGRQGWIITAAVAVVALAAGLVIGGRRAGPGSVAPTDVVHATLTLGDSVAIPTISNIRLAISPSGHRVVFIGPDRADATLWMRDLDQPMAHPLPDTKGAFGPFFSPDGESIGFFTAASGHTVLRLIPTTGGAGRTIVEDSVASYGGGAWGDDGNIYFTNSARGLSRVPAAGGVVTRISQVDSAHSSIREHDFPDVLPGSRHALVMLYKGSEGNHIGLIDLATGAVTDLAPGSYARYVAPGFLAIGTGDGRLLAVRFDPHERKLLGSPVPVLQDVQGESSNATVQFAVSGTGTIIYQRGAGGQTELVWVDRSGRQTPVDTALKGVFQSVALSPDGTRIAVDRAESGETQIWVKQLATGTFSRLSFDVTGADRPVWTPDGRRVAFPATRNNRRTAWIRRADASDSMQAAVPGNTRLDEILFDPLGRYTLLRTEGAALGSRRLLILRNGVDTLPRVLLASKSDNFAMALSPDGQWLAYVSNESGASEVYVRPFPSVDSARFAISVGGGTEPLWRRDGKELFFRNVRGGVFAVPVTTGRHFDHGTPQPLFTRTGMVQQDFFRSYDVHPDGKRFLMLHTGGRDASDLDVIFNWRIELEKLTGATP
jgi:Tol biopolymer transport system component